MQLRLEELMAADEYLTKGDRTSLLLMRACGDILPLLDIGGRLTRAGFVTENGLLTPEGKLFADILMLEDED